MSIQFIITSDDISCILITEDHVIVSDITFMLNGNCYIYFYTHLGHYTIHVHLILTSNPNQM